MVEVALMLSSLAAVDVASDDVNIIIARIPAAVFGLRGPYPDEVVKTLLVNHIVVHPLPQLLIDICSLGTPPEPGRTTIIFIRIACCLMEGSPDDGNTSSLHLLQVAANLTQLLLGKDVLG